MRKAFDALGAATACAAAWGYAFFRRFHRSSAGVMVPTQGVLQMLDRRGCTPT